MKPKNPIDLTQALVRIPSVNPTFDPSSTAEREISNWLKEWGIEHGIETSIHEALDGRANVVFRLRNGADHPHFLLNGHTDTVGVQGMTTPPFGGEISHERLWGRGSTDMKGAVACMMAALIRLREDPTSWRGTLTVGCVADEEHLFRGILKLMEKMDLPDFAVVGEPTSMRVVRGCKGCLRFSVNAQGRSAHSSNPNQGVSAIVAMSDAIQHLESFFREELSRYQAPDFGCSTGCVSLIHGGTGINIVPEHCRIDVDIRLVPGQDWRQTYHNLQTWVCERANRVASIQWKFDEPMLVDLAMDTSADTLLVKTACKIREMERAEVVAYGCDASKIAAKSVPCIIMGPGDIAHAHTADESIALTELNKATEIYVQLARSLLPKK